MSQLQRIENEVYALAPRFEEVLSDKAMKFEAEAGFAIQLMQGNDFLAKVAMGNLPSLHAAIINVASIGVSLSPAKKQAYLVPRKGKICLDISYMGMMHLAQQTGAIQWGQAYIVREHDQFELRGVDEAPLHKYSPFDGEEKRGQIIGAYVVIKTDGGDYLTHCMTIADIYKIRDASEAYKKKQGPWVDHEQEMIKKTVVKQAAKYWPHRDRLQDAIYHVDTEGEEGAAPERKEQDVTPCDADDVAAINDLLQQLGQTWERLAALYCKGLFAGKPMEELTKPHAQNVIKILRSKVQGAGNAND